MTNNSADLTPRDRVDRALRLVDSACGPMALHLAAPAGRGRLGRAMVRGWAAALRAAAAELEAVLTSTGDRE